MHDSNVKQFYLTHQVLPLQKEPGSDGNQEVLCIPQSSISTGASPSKFLVSYPGHPLGASYPSREIQSVYSAAPADWAIKDLSF